MEYKLVKHIPLNSAISKSFRPIKKYTWLFLIKTNNTLTELSGKRKVFLYYYTIVLWGSCISIWEIVCLTFLPLPSCWGRREILETSTQARTIHLYAKNCAWLKFMHSITYITKLLPGPVSIPSFENMMVHLSSIPVTRLRISVIQ